MSPRSPVRRPAPAAVEIAPLLADRWSPRAIAGRPVEPERLRAVFEAARWAPSSFNEQPWRFLVATTEEPEWRERLLGYLKPANAWAHAAPVVVASAYRTTFSRNDRDNRMALRDLGAAEQNAFLEVVRQGLVMHQMAGFDAGALGEELLPEPFAPGSMWVIGHPGDPADLPEKKRSAESAERKRRPAEESVFGPDFGEPAPFVR